MRGSTNLSQMRGWVLAAALLTGCGETTPPPRAGGPTMPPSASASASPSGRMCIVSGKVTSDKNAAVPNATVAAIPKGGDTPAEVAKTDSDGRYCLASLNTGSFGFTITTADQTSAYADVRDVSPRGLNQTQINFQVGGPGYVLSGVVNGDQNAPMPNAMVYISRHSQFEADLFVVQAGADGRYKVKLPAGQYVLRVQSDEVTSQPVNVPLNADKTADLNARRLNSPDKPAPDEVVAWIKSKALPLKSVEAGQGFDDMIALEPLLPKGYKNIVALGEATHGTREFFQLKHRMLEYLVEKKGFRVFGIEASFGDSLPLTNYVATGKGDPAAALANQGFWTWDTEEVLALVKWMRAYNEDKSHKEKLAFWGFDMQSPAASALAVIAFFEKADSAFAKGIGPALEALDDDFSTHFASDAAIPASALTSANATIKTILAKLDADRQAIYNKFGAFEYALVRIHTQVLKAYLAAKIEHNHNLRDEAMAQIVRMILDREHSMAWGAKRPGKGDPPISMGMVLWAHNGHIDKLSNSGSTSMGSILANEASLNYTAFGFAFDEGSFQAFDQGIQKRGLMSFSVAPGMPGSLDHTLARAGIPVFALPLQKEAAGPLPDWFSKLSFTRWVGALYLDSLPSYGFEPMAPAEHFDALLFVQKTTAAHANATGKRPGKNESVAAGTLTDPGFEGSEKGKAPSGWVTSGYPKQLEYTSTVVDKCASGKLCLLVQRVKGDVPTGAGTAALSIDAKPYQGKKVRVSAKARVESKSTGDEAFFVAFTSEMEIIGSPVLGGTWDKVQTEVTVPANAERLKIGMVVTGMAKAGLDDLEVTVVSQGP
ncbi:MAG: erythromycin esterase family protein [Polyangiaceae bacterium]|nr:erythromycin esterase family protein [Polyangiaceae bacterium]